MSADQNQINYSGIEQGSQPPSAKRRLLLIWRALTVDQGEDRLKHRALTEQIIGVFFEVYNELGHGFIESVYEKAFEFALSAKSIRVRRQIEVPVWFRGHKVGDFSADMLVEERVLVELKACRALDGAHEAQLLNYLRATEIEVGLLFNFGLKPQFKRLAFDNRRKHAPEGSDSLLRLLLSSANNNAETND